MFEMIWQFEHRPLADEMVLRPILEAIVSVPGFEPQRYDLNQQEKWRAFDLDRVVVDALTQRTQLLRVYGRHENQLAMLALGKHGEQPTAIIQWVSDVSILHEIVKSWTGLFSKTSLQHIKLTSPQWRQTLEDNRVATTASGDYLGFVHAWCHEGVSPALKELLSRESENSSIIWRQMENHTQLWLSKDSELENAKHLRQLEQIHQLF